MALQVPDYPSVLKQTKWPCGIFNFGKVERSDVCFFNPSLVKRSDGLWLVTRRSENSPGMKIGMNSIMSFRLDKNLAPEYGQRLKTQSAHEGEHFEDPRSIQQNGTTWVSACNFIVFPRKPRELWTGAHQTLMEVNDKWQCVKRHDPVYGGNGPNVGVVKHLEKNWLWFFHEDQLHMLYSASPHKIIRFDSPTKPGKEFVTEAMTWKYGHIRGGTPPIRVGREYWTFFHSSMDTGNKYRRRYYMGAYSFFDTSPFKINRITIEPLLAGSHEDYWLPDKPLVVFPCGSVYENGQWLISFGVNDLKCGWIRIPHDELICLTKPVF